MLLNTDIIEPSTLTGYVRAALADMQLNRFTLARWLPNRTIDDLQYRLVAGGAGLAEAATFRAYDAESPIGSRPGVTRITGELPPVSRKVRLGEYDRLRQRRASDELVQNAVLDDAERMAAAVAARLEMARGEALYKGKLDISENGVVATVDFGRAAGHTVTAATLWTDATNADPLADLLSWVDTYVSANGEMPGVILTSTRVVRLMGAASKFKVLAASIAGTPGVVAPAAINQILAVYGLPPIETYDAKVSVGGSATRVIPDDRVLLLPAAGDPADGMSSELGATLYGTTAESLEPEYGIVDGDQPGIVAGAYNTKDPVAVWTKAAAIALPVLANPNLTFAADVA